MIRDGAPVPDFSTPEAFKQMLIKAKSIAYTDPKLGGTSVVHLMELAEELRHQGRRSPARAIHATGGNDTVAEGRRRQGRDRRHADHRDLTSRARRLAGPLPEPLQLWTVYAAAIPASSTEPAAARAFVAR